MRFVPFGCVREGMTLGKTIFNQNGEVLLHKGTELKPGYLQKIEHLGFNGIYIDDEISNDIELESVVSDEVRNKTVKGVKDIYLTIENGKNIDEKKISETNLLIENIIDDILANKNMMVNMMDLKIFDDYTFFHSVNVTVLSIVVGVAMGLNRLDLHKLGMGALLHDLGKVFVDKKTLNKPGKLTNSEFEELKKHAYLGYQYIKEKFNLPPTSYVAALSHHERYDGTGYPNALKGETINLFGRIIAVCDVYDALTSDRPYRKSMLPSDAMEYIMGNSGSHFDPNIIKLFLRKVAPYPIGTTVKLSNGLSAIVVENYEGWGTRPKVKIISKEPYYIDLKSDPNARNITITEIYSHV